MPLLDRPREKALSFGIETLSDCELLAIILQSGTAKKNVIQVALDLICANNGLSNVFKLNLKELCSYDGIDKIKALQLLTIRELNFRLNRNNLINEERDKIILNSALAVYNYLHEKLESKIQEQLVVLYLNIKNELLCEEIMFKGSDSNSIIDNKIICKKAIELSCKKVIISHNHPSGNCSPSIDDITVFFDLRKALKYLQIKLVDHVIIGNKEYYSIIDESKYKLPQ